MIHYTKPPFVSLFHSWRRILITDVTKLDYDNRRDNIHNYQVLDYGMIFLAPICKISYVNKRDSDVDIQRIIIDVVSRHHYVACSHINLHDDIIYFSCRGHNSDTILDGNMFV